MRKLYEITDIAEIVAWLHELVAGVKVAKVAGAADRKAPSSGPAAAPRPDDTDSDTSDDSDDDEEEEEQAHGTLRSR